MSENIFQLSLSVLKGLFCYLFFCRLVSAELSLKRKLPECAAFGVCYGGVLFAMRYFDLPEPLRSIMIVFTAALYLGLTQKIAVRNALVVNALIFSITLAMQILTVFLAYCAIKLPLGLDDAQDYIAVLVVFSILLSLIYMLKIFTRTARQLTEKNSVAAGIGVGVIAIAACAVFSSQYRDELVAIYMLVSIMALVMVALFVFWLDELLKARYKNQEMEKERAKLLQAIDEQMLKLKEQSAEIHRSKEFIPSMSRQLKALLERVKNRSGDMEIDDLNIALGELTRLNAGQTEEEKRRYAANKVLPTTGIMFIDGQMDVFLQNAREDGVDFEMIVATRLSCLTDKGTVPQLGLQRLLGDILRNALRAIKKSDNPMPSIFLSMGLAGNDTYEIDFYDTGAEFAPEVLARLGERGITTGGTGNGLADTLETLEEAGASLYVTEFEPGTDVFAKCITISFDGKSRRIVRSCRHGEIRSKLPPGSRIIVEPLRDMPEGLATESY